MQKMTFTAEAAAAAMQHLRNILLIVHSKPLPRALNAKVSAAAGAYNNMREIDRAAQTTAGAAHNRAALTSAERNRLMKRANALARRARRMQKKEIPMRRRQLRTAMRAAGINDRAAVAHLAFLDRQENSSGNGA